MAIKLIRQILPILLILPLALHAQMLPTASVEDAVRMTRIQYRAALDGSVAAISPDGRKAAAVVWHGDIERNLNVYTIKLFDLSSPGRKMPMDVMSWDFAGDPEDQVASPFSQLTFLGDSRTLAFLGRKGDAAAQVFTVDTATKQVNQLTHHSSSVRSYVLGPDGGLLAFSAIARASEGREKSRLEEDGVFLWDFELFPFRFEFNSPVAVLRQQGDREIRQYFIAGSNESMPIFDSRRSRPDTPLDMDDPDVAVSVKSSLEDESALSSWATLTGDPAGQRLLLFPYGLTEHPMRPERYAYYGDRHPRNAFVRRVAAPVGLVDVATGRIERLIDAPSPQFERESGNPLWSEDARSVLVYTLLPDAPAEPPQWVEVDIATRETTPLALPKGWKPIAWGDHGAMLVLRNGSGRFGSLRRNPDGGWSSLAEIGAVQDFNPHWGVATNGRVAIGVKDAVLSPPELVAYDLMSGQSTVLSELNPELHKRRYGEVELLQWKSQHQGDAEGFLVRPVAYQPGRRYPLVILFDNGTLRQEGVPYLLDAVWQLNGHAIQMLAAQGFMVLYPRTPRRDDVSLTSGESELMRDNIESAIAHLDRAGMIDPARVGLSGWSRSGYYTDYILIHSSFTFAAATTNAGGAFEYNDGMRPFTDEELLAIRTPKLFQAHGPSSLVWASGMADRMKAFGKPIEILYFHTASHSTTRPQHRLRSLGTHIDWWRFWLKDEEDADPAKASQYTQWRRLRELQARNAQSDASAKGEVRLAL